MASFKQRLHLHMSDISTHQSSPPLSPRNHLQVPPYHLTTHHLPQVTSPHLHNVTQHFPGPHVTSPHLPNPQVPFSQVPYPLVTSPHLLSPPQHTLYNQNHDPGLNNPDWTRSEPPFDISRSFCYSYQNQSTANVDLQNQFSPSTTHHRDELPYNSHTYLTSCVYEQCDTPSPVQDPWRPAVPQLGSMTGGAALGRWGSAEFNSSSEDFSINQFFDDSYNDSSAPQPFFSPTTPGPSPHYPQTPTISSPDPQMHHGKERLSFQTSRQLSRDKSCHLHEYDSYLMTSDPGHQQPQPATQHLDQSQPELIQDKPGLLQGAARNSESCFPPQGRGQDVSGAAQSPDLPAGLSWKEERGGGRRGGRRRGDDIPKSRRRKPESSTEAVKSRLLCTVCKRVFQSLPALNGHMRSHSGSRSAACFKKGEDPSSLFQPSTSLVMPVSVPVQCRGSPKACQSERQGCRPMSPTTGGIALLYRSLMHQEEGEEAARYTPPPMLHPLRAGPGLFCSITTRRQQRVQTVQLHNTHNDPVAIETACPLPGTLAKKPQINEGRDFQADIPKLRVQKYADSDSHNALLLWTPCDELEDPVNQQRVEALLTMARSSVVPGGGASPESALHVLSECRRDFLLTVEKLLSTPETPNNNNNIKPAQQYPSVSWSAAERRLLVKSLQLHQKDFSRIQKAVKTKSLPQCVEFYYLWKKKLSLSVKTPAVLTVTLPHKSG
ncbi:uncharacterized protein LOC131973719 [Centropristis striata]|uniref:uncharacterized protein LOC131973719 n=1 Tax=Centropristis striata TaxID=184440 RepID=UPI0027E1F98C|nr:uncharacterized protein LOC131973719 [Centropristis striata]